MEVVLLGTGAADGWPNPFCRCASCEDARRCGVLRGQTSALVDDELLIDCGPEAPGATSRLGRTLAGVGHLLITHAPPLGVGDDDDRAHIGIEALHRVLEVLSPGLHLHGHIHPHGRLLPDRRLHATTIRNVIPYRLLDLEPR